MCFISCRYGNQETCEFFPENTVPITEPSPSSTERITAEPITTTAELSSSTTERITAEPITTTAEPITTTAETITTTITTTPQPTTSTTEPPTTTTVLIEETTIFNPCAGVNNGSLYCDNSKLSFTSNIFITGNVENPDNCTQFYRCVMQRFVPSQCAEGYVFDPLRLLCVAGDPLTCTVF